MRYMIGKTQLVVAISYLYSLPQKNRCEIKEYSRVENYKKRKKITAVRTNLHNTVNKKWYYSCKKFHVIKKVGKHITRMRPLSPSANSDIVNSFYFDNRLYSQS